MKCFYHSADLDGHCSGAIVKRKYQECEMIGINYGDPFPWDSIQTGEMVIMVDFCLQPFSDMIKLNSMCDLLWIDHHKSAIEEAHQCGFLPWGGMKVEIGRAGCELAWEYFNTDQNTPESVRLLGRYDVWDHSDPDTLPFQYGMRLCEDTKPGSIIWDDLLAGDQDLLDMVIDTGRTILDYIDIDNMKYAKACAFNTTLDGLRCVAINKAMANSKLFESVWDQDKYDAMLSFGYRKGQWHISLYSDKPDVDVSEVAKNYGGGGHKGAAGFQCITLPFMTMEK